MNDDHALPVGTMRCRACGLRGKMTDLLIKTAVGDAIVACGRASKTHPISGIDHGCDWEANVAFDNVAWQKCYRGTGVA